MSGFTILEKITFEADFHSHQYNPEAARMANRSAQ
jgi:hypothetical protein